MNDYNVDMTATVIAPLLLIGFLLAIGGTLFTTWGVQEIVQVGQLFQVFGVFVMVIAGIGTIGTFLSGEMEDKRVEEQKTIIHSLVTKNGKPK